MNAVEIEAALSDLALQPFDQEEFSFAFLAAFGHKDTTIKRLRTGNNNTSDVTGGVLLRNNIHIAACNTGSVGETLRALRNSPSTTKAKAKFILATDGQTVEAEELIGGETRICDYADLPNHFGFFLPLAGISTIQEIKDNPIDVRATGRLNKLYVELLRENPEWATNERRHDMNHFMARLIFCFFAEDTDIFSGISLFTQTVEQMSERDGSNTHEVLEAIFRAMNIKVADRANAVPRLPNWANSFPYVNGGLFSGSTDVPCFTRMARTYFLHAGGLNWKEINPDIFGSMIQAVADDEERGALGMHYTSVPNILKVLNPLFLDGLRAQLAEAGDNERKLLNLRKRMAHIRVFDPACGSGNFLVIAYKQMREIEAEINRRRGELHLGSEIPLTNFRGIELRDFPAQIARLALIIAEFQCDVLFRGQKDALAEFLPLDAQNWIVCHNALQLDWLSVCPPTGTGVKLLSDDLFGTPLQQAEIEFENEGGETYICGNPPYKGSKWQSGEQKADLANAWLKHPKLAKTTDYVTGWFAKFLDYVDSEPNAVGAFVATNSVCQGQQAIDVWPAAFQRGCEICFAHTSFKWANLASYNAGVTVVIVGLSKKSAALKKLYQDDSLKQCTAISPYLVPNSLAYVQKANEPISEQSPMLFGNMPRDGGHLFLDSDLAAKIMAEDAIARPFIKHFVGSDELINGRQRYCLWIEDDEAEASKRSAFIAQRLKLVADNRSESDAESTRQFARQPHRFVQIAGSAKKTVIVVPRVSSENRPYLPVDYLSSDYVVGDRNFALYDAPLWNLALVASRLHWVWIGTVCVRMRTDFSYSNTLGWNTFPVPLLTEQNKVDLTACAENILLAREKHYPATIADLYDPENMPDNLRHAHEHNDEVLERIYIGRRFKNDTERLEKLFELYSKVTAAPATGQARKESDKEKNSVSEQTNNPTNTYTVPSVSITTARTGASSKANALGMRAMQERAYAKRGEQYLLIKSPPASGKSRALMFIALDKLNNQGLQQAIIVVPERSIGGSFADEPLSQHGFYWDWQVAPQWNLCNAPGVDEPRVAKSKVEAVRKFLESADKVLVCTHATFRFAVEELGIQAFDNRLIAIDEFHHVSSNPDNKLGSQLGTFIARDKVHLVAMTGSYFRGDSEAVLGPADEARFETITYTYYEQLNGYRWLKSLDIGYFFYTGPYVNAIAKVLDPALKTIVHIPNVNARESLKDKEREVNEIMHGLGEWKGIDPATGFHLVKARDGRTLKVADLVDDSDPAKRSKVLTALKDPAQKDNRDSVDVIIALGMAKEGFDWIWCEHALTIGYRSSLTEIVQIIGRATRDAEGKERSRFTNLIAEPAADQSAVAEAVNDMLKAISASLLMEQVLAPRYEFTPKNAGPKEGFDYGEDGYKEGGHNIGVNQETGQYHVEINGLTTPQSPEATRICKEDLNEVVTSFLQDKTVLERGLFDKENTLPEEITQLRMGKIVRERYPDLSESDQEAIRQHAVAAMNITQQAKLALAQVDANGSAMPQGNTALIDGVRKFVNVRDLDIDLIDRINPFDAAYAVLAKAMDEKSLRQVQASIAAKRVNIPEDEARELAKRALQFKNERGRLPDINSADAWEKRMAEGVAALARYRAQAKAAQAQGESNNG